MGKKKNKRLDSESRTTGMLSIIGLFLFTLAMFPVLLITVPFIVIAYLQNQKD